MFANNIKLNGGELLDSNIDDPDGFNITPSHVHALRELQASIITLTRLLRTTTGVPQPFIPFLPAFSLKTSSPQRFHKKTASKINVGVFLHLKLIFPYKSAGCPFI